MNTIEEGPEYSETGGLIHRRRRHNVNDGTRRVVDNIPQAAGGINVADASTETTIAEASKEVAKEIGDLQVAKRIRPRRTEKEVGRNRVSPARLHKLNEDLSPEQKKLINKRHFGGLLFLPSKTTAWFKMIGNMGGKADDKFLRAWLIAAMTCFLLPNHRPECQSTVLPVLQKFGCYWQLKFLSICC